MAIHKIIEMGFKFKYYIRKLYYGFKVESIGKGTCIDSVTFIGGKKKKHKGIVIENDCVIRSGTILITKKDYEKSGIVMKKGSGINRNCYIGGEGGIIIGKGTQIGPHTCILSTNHIFSDKNKLIKDQPITYKEIVLEDDVWIGANVNILEGVRIGKGSVIGAGAVVTKDIPPYSIAVGVPAKVIKKRE